VDMVVVSNVRPRLREICSLLEAMEGSMEVTPVEGGLDHMADLPAHQEPKVMILDCEGKNGSELEKIEHLHHLYPDMACIVVTESTAPEFLIGAMRAGVREVLPLPLSGSVLASALGRVAKKTNGHERRHGQVLAFVACKGGGGTTFLAANMAHVLSQHEKKVLLIDLNLQFGDAALFVSDQKATTTVADVAEEINRVDASFLASCVVNVTPDFAVLAAPDDPARARLVKPEHVDTLLRLVRHHYDFIVIDTGRGLDPVGVRALDHADLIYPVLQQTLPFIRDGKRLIEAFRSLGYGKEKIRIVVNRYQNGGDIGLDDVKQSLGYAVAHVVPNQFADVAASVNQGVPILKLSPNSTVSKALLDMAGALVTLSGKTNGSWLSRVFHRA
jgi:pilus assembly protein CpaE